MTGLDALPLVAIVWIVLALAAAGLVHGTLGLGFPLVATPLIALITDIKTAVVLVAPATLVVVIAAILIGGPFLQALRDWWRAEYALPVAYPNWTQFGWTAALYLIGGVYLIGRAAGWA